MKTFKATMILSVLALMAGAATAQDYPNRNITLVVPAAAGGPSDTVARLIADKMSSEFGTQVLIENMGGAGGSLGAARVAKAEPDGYTLMLYHVGVSTFGALYPNLPYDTNTAFSSVGLVTDVPMTLVSRKDLAATDVAGLLDWLKGEGTGATFGTAGIGSVSDLCGRQLSESAGIELTVVPYKGTGPAMTDLLGGQIDLMCDQTTNTANQIKAGEITPFAVTTPERIALLPDTPSLAESGLEGFNLSAWHAVWAPAGTPDAVRTRLSEALQKALTDQEVIDRLAALGTTPVAADLATPAAMDARFTSEVARWTKLLAETGAN